MFVVYNYTLRRSLYILRVSCLDFIDNVLAVDIKNGVKYNYIVEMFVLAV